MKQKNLTDNLQELPKWAQSEINVLQMRLREAKDEILRMTNNPKSNTVLGHNFSINDEPIKYLKDNQIVTFCLSDGEMTVGIKGDGIEVSTHTFSSKEMSIIPRVSNVIKIQFK